jgi:hypothetical protein
MDGPGALPIAGLHEIGGSLPSPLTLLKALRLTLRDRREAEPDRGKGRESCREGHEVRRD